MYTMKKQIKNLISIFTICIVFQSLKCSTVFAAENTEVKINTVIDSLKIANSVDDKLIDGKLVQDIKSSSNVDNLSKYITEDVKVDSTLESVSVTKVWKIKFNDELDSDSVNNNLRIIDKDTNEELKINIQFQENNKTLIVSSQYLPNKTYTLVINKNIKSKTNKHLNNIISKKFITDKDVKPTISSIDNINVTIKQKDKFTLPTTVNAIMSNGNTEKISASWNESLKNTDIPGTYVFYGNIVGYEKKVQLKLIIKPIENNTNNNSNNNNANEDSNSKEPNEGKNDIGDLNPRSTLHRNLYNYLMNDNNRQSVMKRAIELHGGDLSNNCVYFASEALRRSGLNDLPKYVCNTVELTGKLKNMGWSTSRDFSKLRPGDICFTKSYGAGPTHTYVFMKWVIPGRYDYAYICDNQGNEYGSIYHKRNVNFATETKDPTIYFMYKP